MLGQRADAIRIERPDLPDAREHLAGAAHLAGRDVFEDEHEQVVAQRVFFTREARSRSEEHTSELQSLMRKSYAVCCLKKKKLRAIIIHASHCIDIEIHKTPNNIVS